MSGVIQSKNDKYRYIEIIERIKRMIRSSELKVGDRLPPERELADSFKVSRNCLRQAIQALSERRVLESRRGAGTYVCAAEEAPVIDNFSHVLHLRKDLIREILEFRLILEPSIAALAAVNITVEELDRLKIIVCDQERKILSGIEDPELDSAFHLGLVAATKNRIVMKVAETSNEILKESRPQPLWTETRQRASVVGHLRIIDALESRDPDRAAEAMRDHLRRVERMVFGESREEPGDSSE